ncbi:MAG TPA: hypothetical protein VEU55_03200 [Gemmatimonadales bacterium]|nr:hypothetical protein [Gemmatimonadales bacterium]
MHLLPTFALLALLGSPPSDPALESLPHASVSVDASLGRMVIELPAVELPAPGAGHDMTMVSLPLCQVTIPIDAWLHSARVEVVDAAGRALPPETLHHFNLSDPGRRELFLPITLHLLAASKETPHLEVPALLFGVPIERGQRLIVGAMLANTSTAPYHGVHARLVLRYVRAGRPWPLYRVYPWAIDVQYPLGTGPTGSKAFDLPPGHTERSWEGSPAVAGTILGLGGHLHDYGVSLELRDVTTGTVLWHGTPITDGPGRVVSFPVVRFYNWHRLGIHIVPAHRYRLTAAYDNPTNHVIADGGMGAAGGLFIPDHGVAWPVVDPRDSVYQEDLKETILAGGMGAMMMDHAAH